MEIKNKVAIVTGAGSGIGQATATELTRRGVKGLGLVDRSDAVCTLEAEINAEMGHDVAKAYMGDTTDQEFRKKVYDDVEKTFGVVAICVPAASITRDALSVKLDKTTGKATLYPQETFRLVTEINLIAPVYWGVGNGGADRRRPAPA